MTDASLSAKISANQNWLVPLTLLFCVFASRFPVLNDFMVGTDGAWFIYVGGQILHGYWPYVDLWDRKPVGLFLLYAPFSLLGSWQFWGCLLGTDLFTFLTGMLIYKIGCNFATALGGFLCALLYLFLSNCLTAFTGIEAIFYNLFVLSAFALVLLRFEKLQTDSSLLFKTGLQAMAIFGFTIELKPTVAFEGIYLACFLLSLCWLQEKSIKKLLLNSALWIFLALLPTLMIAGIYALHGHWQAWFYANLVSFFQKQGFSAHAPQSLRLYLFIFFFSGGLLLSLKGLKERKIARNYLYFITGWFLIPLFMASAIGEYAAVTLPILLPFCLSFIFLFPIGKKEKAFFLCLLLLAFGGSIIKVAQIWMPLDQYLLYKKSVQTLRQDPDCLFIYGGEEIQNITKQSANCHLTRYPYPSHLGEAKEQKALGISDTNAELAAILQKRPKWIFIGIPIVKTDTNLPKNLLLQHKFIQKELTMHYRVVQTTDTLSSDGIGLYRRID
ncbi:hypothetical protein FAI40_03760 [Acetobacteraceae bacterium]|nr:hypothetical protein FAI40_03760 [Acetobacteraceae bacterium]